LHEAIDAGLDLYLTGEVTEWVQAVAQESNVAFVAAGHHATERFGARRMAEVLRQEGLDAEFVDVENPA
jgi:putative NIF3 family GTP cyclohydrolase 1 type 2